MNILIIENDEIYTKVIRKTFEDVLKYYLEMSFSVKESIALLEHETYDLVILNLDIEGQSGKKIIDYIRKTLNDKYTYIIVLTVENSEEFVEELYTAEVDYCLTKPFDPILLKLLSDRIDSRLKQFSCEYKGEK